MLVTTHNREEVVADVPLVLRIAGKDRVVTTTHLLIYSGLRLTDITKRSIRNLGLDREHYVGSRSRSVGVVEPDVGHPTIDRLDLGTYRKPGVVALGLNTSTVHQLLHDGVGYRTVLVVHRCSGPHDVDVHPEAAPVTPDSPVRAVGVGVGVPGTEIELHPVG